MVKVFPEPVYPYAKTVAWYPYRTINLQMIVKYLHNLID
jgi:hypothetical protein